MMKSAAMESYYPCPMTSTPRARSALCMDRPPTGYDRAMSDSMSAGDDSVVSVLNEFRSAGWGVNHVVGERGTVECGECGRTSAAEALTIDARHRVEGASDPDDMQIVLGFACPACGAAGAVVAAYGPTGSENDLDFMSQVDHSDAPDPLADVQGAD